MKLKIENQATTTSKMQNRATTKQQRAKCIYRATPKQQIPDNHWNRDETDSKGLMIDNQQQKSTINSKSQQQINNQQQKSQLYLMINSNANS